MTVMRLSASAAYWAGSIRRRADSSAPTLLLCAVLLLGILTRRPAPLAPAPSAEQPLAVKITFFDGLDSVRYEVRDAADFDADVLLEVHHRFYGPAVPDDVNADTDEEP